MIKYIYSYTYNSDFYKDWLNTTWKLEKLPALKKQKNKGKAKEKLFSTTIKEHLANFNEYVTKKISYLKRPRQSHVTS